MSNHDEMKPDQYDEDIIVLKDEDGNEVKFEYLDSFSMHDKEYVVLLPIEDIEEGEVVILEMHSDGDSEEFLPVENEEMLNEVFQEFKQRMKDEFDFE
ncbi:MAG: DUF1292 domain-containing protein [Bacillota bacterium]